MTNKPLVLTDLSLVEQGSMLVGIHELRQYYAEHQDTRQHILQENDWWDWTVLTSVLLAAGEADNKAAKRELNARKSRILRDFGQRDQDRRDTGERH